MAIGLALILFVSGAIEGFVTPSGLPTWARIGIGILAESSFLTYVYVLGVFLGLPVLWILFENMLNLGIGFGLMSSAGRLDTFLGLVLPHGLLELTAVFVAAGTGLRLGWTLVDPGPRTRRTALAEEGRAAVGMAIGLALVLFVSGAIEGFVTPSGLPTWARISIGIAAELAFLAYVFVLGGRATRAGETGDLASAERSSTVPSAA
jgi:uncharacterized membrane protein SpoIIM required for sporulation